MNGKKAKGNPLKIGRGTMENIIDKIVILQLDVLYDLPQKE